MKSEEARPRFVAGGGWIRQEFTAAWFGAFAVAFSNISEISMAWWNTAALGQLALFATAIVVSCLEKPVMQTRLVQNPDTKPECLY